jgi:formate--tetrahydrofolate ligase
VAALREPSLGPVFGMKGGGTGGGRATLEPSAGHQPALHGRPPRHHQRRTTSSRRWSTTRSRSATRSSLDPRNVRWRRAMDMNDRALRHVVVGMGKGNGPLRETAFDITAASEVMAILCLATSAKDLEARLGRIVVGTPPRASPSPQRPRRGAGDDRAAPRRPHAQPRADPRGHARGRARRALRNIAHGCNSILATRLALAYGDDVVTEAGFGFDLGAEKFLDIKCRVGGLWPRGVVLVATHRALKMHGGVPVARAGDPDVGALDRGLDHLGKHLETLAHLRAPRGGGRQRLPNDTEDEAAALRSTPPPVGVTVARCEGFARGGEGALELADATLDMLANTDAHPPTPRYVYELSDPPEEKVRKIAHAVYGADDVTFTAAARKDLDAAVQLGGAELPVCMAKTHLSLSDDATRRGGRGASPSRARGAPRRGRGLSRGPHRRDHDHAGPPQGARREARGGARRRTRHRAHAGRVGPPRRNHRGVPPLRRTPCEAGVTLSRMVRIAQLSDFHLLESDHARRRGVSLLRLKFLSAHRALDAARRVRCAREALSAARATAPDHVVLTGDLTEDGTVAQFEVLADLLHSRMMPAVSSMARPVTSTTGHSGCARKMAWAYSSSSRTCSRRP